MIARSVIPAVLPSSLYELTGVDNPRARIHVSGTANITIGDATTQTFPTNAPLELYPTNLRNVYTKGNAADTLSILIFSV